MIYIIGNVSVRGFRSNRVFFAFLPWFPQFDPWLRLFSRQHNCIDALSWDFVPQSAILMEISRSIFVVALSIYVNLDRSPMDGCVRIDWESPTPTVVRNCHDRSKLEKNLGQVAASPPTSRMPRPCLLAIIYYRACLDLELQIVCDSSSKATKKNVDYSGSEWMVIYTLFALAAWFKYLDQQQRKGTRNFSQPIPNHPLL